jgi:tetratricopeptide (TPR) repeat protein
VNRSSRAAFLTTKEKVMLHLMAYQRYNMDDDAPKAVSQDGIAAVVDVGRNNLAKVLGEMVEESLAEVKSKHVKGMPSVRKVYFLTQGGFNRSMSLRDELEATHIMAVDLQGQEQELPLAKLAPLLPKNYNLLEVCKGIEKGRIDCRSFHEGKIKEERRYVDFTDKKPAVRNFFGREEEMRVLNDFVGEGPTRLLVIQGIPGIGKTTMVAKFAQDVRERIHVYWFKLHEWVNAKALLRPLAEFLSQLGKKNLEWYLTQTELPNVGEVCQILETDMKDVSALLIIDDLQKAAPDVAKILEGFATIMDQLPDIRMIWMCREMPTCYPRGHVVSGLIKEIVLEGLDEDSGMRLLRGKALPETSLKEIFRVTGGHPLFLELVESPESVMGKTIRVFIEQEVFSRLGPMEKRLVGIACIFRYPVMMDAFFLVDEDVQKELGMEAVEDPSMNYDAISSLLAKSIFHESVGRMIGMHDVMREFSYSRLTPRQRTAYHRAAGHFYRQDHSPASAVEALYHSLMARDQKTAVAIAAGSGRDMIERGYAVQFSPLLDQLAKLPPPERSEHIELLFLQSEILDIEGEWDRAIARFSELLAQLSADKDRRLMGEIERRLGAINVRRTAFEEALLHLQNGLAIATEIGDKHTLAYINYDLGGISERRGRYEEAEKYFRTSQRLAEEIGDRAAVANALYGLGRVLGSLMKSEEAVSIKRKALDVLSHSGGTRVEAKLQMSVGNDLCDLGRVNESLEHFSRAVELSSSLGDVAALAFALSNHAAALIELHDFDKALEMLATSQQINRKLNDPFVGATIHLYRGYVYRQKGNWDWAKGEFDLCLETMRKIEVPMKLSQFLFEIGKMHVEEGETAKGKALLMEAYQVASAIGHRGLMDETMKAMQSMT